MEVVARTVRRLTRRQNNSAILVAAQNLKASSQFNLHEILFFGVGGVVFGGVGPAAEGLTRRNRRNCVLVNHLLLAH